MLRWEQVKGDPEFVYVWRAKVPGGWLVFAGRAVGGCGITFYPDPDHEWSPGVR